MVPDCKAAELAFEGRKQQNSQAMQITVVEPSGSSQSERKVVT